MDVSGEAADLVVKESLQLTAEAVKLTGEGLKNVAALLLAIRHDKQKVVGKTNAKTLAKDPAPTVVAPLKPEDEQRFHRLAKTYGLLYFIPKKRGLKSSLLHVVSTETHAAKLNAVFQSLGYPIPEKAQEEPVKNTPARVPPEKSLPGRGNGLSPQRTAGSEKPSVKGRLASLQAASQGMKTPVKQKGIIR